ncbi:hypothetical protein PZ938_17600, partial [Luteipulveratus sp. YIM 133132]|uniref:hypothetical protein n=1 Tax=Luteipulveratus flavus TaxID=3031728 RepID=UPI0023B14D52
MTSARNRNLFVAVGITASLGVGAVAATSAMADPPGNNGTVKVHELGTPAGTESNDPKLCVFNFEAFDLDANQTGNITILPQGGDTDTTDSLTLTLTTDANGDGATAYVNDGGALTLDDGHYKATLDNKFGTDPGDKAKTKVFKINCETSTTTTSTTTTSSTSSTTPPETTSTTPPETTSTTPPETTSTTPP